MPKLPILKNKELIKILFKMGFYKCRQRGTSHLIMAHPNGKRTTIAIHQGKDIPTGTLKAILRDINISVEEFIKIAKDKK